MADLSALGALQPIEPLNLDDYKDVSSGGFQLPPKGRYTVQAPPEFPPSAFGRTKREPFSLLVSVDPTIVGPTNDGFVLRFSKVSAKQFRRSGKPASQLGDYLRAFGIRTNITDEQQAADLVESTANQTYQVDVDWKAYYRDGFTLEGMEKFPSDGKGGHLQYVDHPSIRVNQDGEELPAGTRNPDGTLAGEPLRLRANAYISRYIPLS